VVLVRLASTGLRSSDGVLGDNGSSGGAEENECESHVVVGSDREVWYGLVNCFEEVS
jgi:hypothetical protein